MSFSLSVMNPFIKRVVNSILLECLSTSKNGVYTQVSVLTTHKQSNTALFIYSSCSYLTQVRHFCWKRQLRDTKLENRTS